MSSPRALRATHRPGRIDFLPLQWILLCAVASWLLVRIAWHCIYMMIGGAA